MKFKCSKCKKEYPFFYYLTPGNIKTYQIYLEVFNEYFCEECKETKKMNDEQLERIAAIGNLLEVLKDSIRIHSEGIEEYKGYLAKEREKRNIHLEQLKRYIERKDLTMIIKCSVLVNSRDEMIKMYKNCMERYTKIIERDKKRKKEVLTDLKKVLGDK